MSLSPDRREPGLHRFLGLLPVALAVVFALLLGTNAQAAVTPAETVWRLLDYVAVDYPGAVRDGRIISAAEYAEMSEFSETVVTQMATLPPTKASRVF
jgi:high-affinity iron transporter